VHLAAYRFQCPVPDDLPEVSGVVDGAGTTIKTAPFDVGSLDDSTGGNSVLEYHGAVGMAEYRDDGERNRKFDVSDGPTAPLILNLRAPTLRCWFLACKDSNHLTRFYREERRSEQ
jgi:hypothetical protein